MKTIKRIALFRALMLFFAIGFVTILVGCTEENIDSAPQMTHMVFELPELGYAYDALEPYIDAQTMEIHHTKHHNGYVNNLNQIFKSHPQIDVPLEQILADLSLIPADIRTAVKNNGGGYYNHNLYFSILKINQGQIPSAELGIAINQAFGSFDGFKEIFAQAALTQFGSGWAWLIVTDEGLKIVSTLNQDTPLDRGIPILCIDVWEHAYYLNYQNRRSDYIQAFFNIIDWDKVAELYTAAKN